MDNRLAQIRADAKSEGWDWDYWVRNEQDERALLQGCRPDPKAADHVVDFFARFLKHSKGEWNNQPFTLLDWQRDGVVKPLFGWKRPDGLRRFRRAGIWVPKKNGKSTLAAGLALYLLDADDEPGAEVYCVAVDRSQASIVFDHAASMTRSCAFLSKRLKVTRTTKTIANLATSSVYRALSSDVPAKEGLNISALIFDELHAQATRAMWDTLVYGGAARRQPLFITISTAGWDRFSLGYEHYEYARDVVAGTVEDIGFLSFIAEAEKDDDWSDPEVWRKANPSYGVTVREDAFLEDFRNAKNMPSEENTFRRRRLNQWTEQYERWLTLEKWDACGGEIDLSDLDGRDCYGGLDLATTSDTTAFVLLFPDDEDGYDLLAWFWLPRDTARDRVRRDKAPYDPWIRDGFITVTEGDTTDYAVVRRDINAIAERYAIRSLGLDRLFQGAQLATELMADGFDVKAFAQGFISMAAPTKAFGDLVISGKLRHGDNPVMRWMASNVGVETDAAGNMKPSRTTSSEKIDGIVAAIMALARAEATAGQDSIYETETPVLF